MHQVLDSSYLRLKKKKKKRKRSFSWGSFDRGSSNLVAKNECKQTISVEAERAGVVIEVCREGSEGSAVEQDKCALQNQADQGSYASSATY